MWLDWREKGEDQARVRLSPRARARSRRDPQTMSEERGLHSKDRGKPSKGLRSKDTMRSVVFKLSPATEPVVEEANVDSWWSKVRKELNKSLRDLGRSSYNV